MHVTRREELPFEGMSHRFVGADHGPVNISAYFVHAPPGRGAPPHRHPYDEVMFVQSGRGRWTVNGIEREGGPGDIMVVKAGEIHSFVNIGDVPLVQLDVHLSPQFVQENIT